MLFCDDFFPERHSFPLLLSIPKPHLSFEEKIQPFYSQVCASCLDHSILLIISSQGLSGLFCCSGEVIDGHFV